MEKCNYCNKEKPEDEMFFNDICDDCFDKQMSEEAEDFKIYDKQEGRCFTCKKTLTNWFVKNKRAFCSTECATKN